MELDGHEVSIIDSENLGLDEKQTASLILKKDPDFVGFTAMTPTISWCGKVAQMIKEANPRIGTIIGGIHATALPVKTLRKFPAFDLLVRGEGEITIRELFVGGKLRMTEGVIYRQNDSCRLFPMPERNLVENLDTLPHPARHLIDNGRYFVPRGNKKFTYTPIMASRGCPFDCIFCMQEKLWTRHVRYRSPENIISELKQCREYGIESFNFIDDTFTLNRKWLEKICSILLTEKLDMPWSCCSRVNTIDSAMLKIMKKAGCQHIHYGVESGNQAILNMIQKGITIEQARKAFEITRKEGMKSTAYFMIGHPWETRRTILDTIILASRLPADIVQFSMTTPFEGTALREMIEKGEGKMRLLTEDWDNYSHYAPPVMQVGAMGPSELEFWRKIAFFLAFLNSRRLFEVFRNVYKLKRS